MELGGHMLAVVGGLVIGLCPFLNFFSFRF